jgi:hypothetical protein
MIIWPALPRRTNTDYTFIFIWLQSIVIKVTICFFSYQIVHFSNNFRTYKEVSQCSTMQWAGIHAHIQHASPKRAGVPVPKLVTSWKLGDCRSIDWKTYQVICSSPEFSLVLEITFGQEEKWDPLQCDQVFSGAITTSGYIKLLHWAKNYHGTIFSPIMVVSGGGGGGQKIFRANSC